MKLKIKDVTKFLLLSVVFLFLAVYLASAGGYFDYTKSENMRLTNDAIKHFDKDIKSGKTIKNKSYLPKKKNYDNNLSRMGYNASKFIDNSFKKIMNALFSEIDKAITK